MRSIKYLSLTLSFISILPLSAIAKNKYPFVESLTGKVWITGAENHREAARKKEVLQTRALVETGAGARIQLRWDEKRSVVIGENTEVLVPAISFETGEAPLVILKKGDLHWEALKSEGAYKVALHSDLFEFLAPPADFGLSYDPVKAYTEVRVFAGRLEFSAMNGEETVLVQSNQKAGFQGVLEDGKIAYDILLKGKKIPRGQLTPVRSLAKSEKGLLAEAALLKKQELAAKKALEQKQSEAKKNSKQICHEPPAKFNECAWVCQGNPKKEKKICYLQDPTVTCLRQRCNANGEWSDSTPISGEKAQSLCKAQAVVGPCDY